MSHQSGLIFFQNDDKSSEMGVWQCTPGTWRCEVSKDEFFRALAGRSIYT
ncbi:MAG: cupin domain-containing protein [Alphaproteobacteria bacterium]